MTMTSYQNTSPHTESTIAVTSFIRLINDILWNMENKLVTVVTILYLSAAFDTLDHNLLLEVLHNKFVWKCT